MRNGIKKYVIASIPIIFGCLFGYGNTYNIVESCTRNSFCVEFDANETVNYTGLNFQGQKGTTNIELSTDIYNNVLAYKFNSNSDKYMTYAYFWSENGFTTYAGYHGGGSYNINKQTYVCTNTASGYTGCLMEDTSTLWNSTGNLAQIDNIFEGFTANKYVINLYNKGRGSYGPSTFCMIDTTNDMSICIKNDYYTAGNRPRQTLLQTGTNDNSVLYIDSLYTLLATSVPPTNTPIAPSGGGETTGSNVVCPSVQFKISMYGYKYNTGLCYSDSIEFTGGQIVQVEPQSIFEIFSGYQDYINWKLIYENNCHAPYTQEHCTSAMLSNWKATQIFNKIENAGLDSEKVYQYCHLQLNIEDKSQGICNMTDEELYATGVNQQASNPNPFESLTDFIEENINLGVEAPTTGTVFDEFLEDGETRISAITINRFGEFRKLYQKVMGLFKYRTTQPGIIPGYITGIIMMILLLFIFKK